MAEENFNDNKYEMSCGGQKIVQGTEQHHRGQSNVSMKDIEDIS